MKKVYNKLVRDNIPSIIEKDNKTCITRVLNDEEYVYELKKKLQEETLELLEANNIDNLKSEMADILEVLDALQEYYGIYYSEVLARKASKVHSRGRFVQRIFLESVEE